MLSLLQDALPRLVVQIALVVSCSRLLGLLVRHIKQPMVIAEISAGILLGPSLFGWLAPHAHGAVFPADSYKVLQLLSQLGLILFMFLVGVELDLTRLRGRAYTSVVISHVSIIVPFALGLLLAVHLRVRLCEPNVRFSSFALFLGVAMSITAFPVLARILAEHRLLQTPVGALTIACAAVDDVTAWCILAFVVATAHSQDLNNAIASTALALAYIAFMVLVVRPVLRYFADRLGSQGELTKNALAAILLLLFVAALGTELIGVHALFGAFMFGAVLPKSGLLPSALSQRLEDLVVVVLLPLFFACSGIRTQIGLLSTAGDWGICALIIAFACLGKFGASMLAARWSGLGWREAGALGVLMNTRGLMELVVLNIGLDLGVIGPRLFTMMVVMALVTTFLTTPLLTLFRLDSEFQPDSEREPMVAATLSGVPAGQLQRARIRRR